MSRVALRRQLGTMCLFTVLLARSAVTPAAEGPLVRIDVDPANVAVGEPVALTVTVLASTWFPKPPAFPSFELANAVTRLPPNSSYPTSERVGGETWSGIVRQYRIFPLIGAEFRMNDLQMTVIYADPDAGAGATTTAQVPVPEIAFTAAVPPGAEGLDPYIAGRRLSLRRELGGDPTALTAGDGLVVRYVAELDGLPSMFLPPPVAVPEIRGVSVYADQPTIEDGPPARRLETLTFVFEAGGEFQIPGARLDWWNTEARTVETAQVEPLTLSVAGPPLEAAEPEPTSEPVDWRRVVEWTGLIASILWLLLRVSPNLKAWAARLHDRHVASEGYAFRRLRRALRGNDPSRAHTALLTWLDRIEPGLGSREFARRFGDGQLQRQIADAGARHYRDGQPVDLRSLERSLTIARQSAKRHARDKADPALPPLNP